MDSQRIALHFLSTCTLPLHPSVKSTSTLPLLCLYSTPTLFYSAFPLLDLLYPTLRYSTLLCSILRYSALLCSALLCFYPALPLLYSTSALLYSTLLYSTLLQGHANWTS